MLCPFFVWRMIFEIEVFVKDSDNDSPWKKAFGQMGLEPFFLSAFNKVLEEAIFGVNANPNFQRS